MDRRFLGERRLVVVAVLVERRAGAERRLRDGERRIQLRRDPSERRMLNDRRRQGRRS